MRQLDPLLGGLPPSEGQSAVDFQLDQFQQGVSNFSPWENPPRREEPLGRPMLVTEVSILW